MLLDLEIVNGDLTPKFDKYVEDYSVTVSKDIESLIINYKSEEGYDVEILNNENLQPGDNFVYIELKNESIINTYTLNVYKEKEKEVISINDEALKIEVKKEMPSYIPYAIFGSCLLVIIIAFWLLFRKKKTIKKK